MKASSIFSPGEDSMRITLSDTFRLIAKKNTSSFLWCPRLMYSAPQYPVFRAGYCQRDTQDWTPGVKTSLCKASVDYLPGNSSSRYSGKVSSNLRNRCPPSSDPVQMSMLCGDLGRPS
ncbi:hypothetical protein TNCV_108061 [Trichonephila clavipes]|nr:hypothetical protein TNCV_108061 [Trichonephila clavipes]